MLLRGHGRCTASATGRQHGHAAPPQLCRPARRRREQQQQRILCAVAESAAPQQADIAASSSSSNGSAPQPHGRIYNFSAGPGALPMDVLEQAANELLNWRGSGVSVMEMSHRGKEFESIISAAEADLRQLLGVPSNYKVLFLQGGASTQFAAIPLNLTAEGDVVDHVVTGAWSKKAFSEAKKYCNAHLVCKGDSKSIPPRSDWSLSGGAAKYVHYCDNETIDGVEFSAPPEVEGVTLVSDMSSNFCSRPVDVSKFGLIYAGAQKNVGPAGVTIVIVREDLLGNARAVCPTMLDYGVAADNASLYNTPACWSIYVCGLVFQKLLREGGLPAVAERNARKAQMLYDAVAASGGFYASPVQPRDRSRMNVPFTIPFSKDLEKVFLKEAATLGMVQLKGHRSVGGMRASIYNAMPLEGVQQLTEFMESFHARHAK